MRSGSGSGRPAAARGSCEEGAAGSAMVSVVTVNGSWLQHCYWMPTLCCKQTRRGHDAAGKTDRLNGDESNVNR